MFQLQVDIASRGAQLLRPGGMMVYSTCSIDPVENEAVIAELVRKCPWMEVVEIDESNVEGLVWHQGLTSWMPLDENGKVPFSFFRFPLDADFVNPLFIEVVAIEQADGKMPPADELPDRNRTLFLKVLPFFNLLVIWTNNIQKALSLTVTKFMPLLVLPTHGLLDRIMKLAESRVRGNGKAAPDFWLNLVKKDFYEVAHEYAREMSLRP